MYSLKSYKVSYNVKLYPDRILVLPWIQKVQYDLTFPWHLSKDHEIK